MAKLKKTGSDKTKKNEKSKRGSEKKKYYDSLAVKYGVDPATDKKIKKSKERPSLIKLLNPRNLQYEVSKYGYSFSSKKFFISVLSAMVGAIGVGFLFQLRWYFNLLIIATCILCVPLIFYISRKNMYESKRFHDVTNYMEQLLYSFRRKKKILTSLEDVQISFEGDDGKMKEVIEKAIDYIRTSETSGDIYREALDIIESEYNNDRLRNVHNFLIAVENNGGSVENPVDLLLDERAMWDQRVHTFQKERNATKRNIVLSICFSLCLCFFILFILNSDSLKQLAIIQNTVVQITSTLVILFNIFLYTKIVNKLSQSWLKHEKKYSDYQVLKDYFYVIEFDKKKELKTSFLYSLIFVSVIVLGLVISNKVIAVIGGILFLFCLLSSEFAYRASRKSTLKEIEKAFPQWLMELALILQGDNVQVAISKTLETAPVVLRPELYKLVEGFEKEPNSIIPYNNFMKEFDLPEIKSAMRMLYSITTTGSASIDEQITDLIKKQNVLMDKAEKIANEDHLAGFSTLSLLPMLFCIFKSVADMTILVFSLFGMIDFNF